MEHRSVQWWNLQKYCYQWRISLCTVISFRIISWTFLGRRHWRIATYSLGKAFVRQVDLDVGEWRTVFNRKVLHWGRCHVIRHSFLPFHFVILKFNFLISISAAVAKATKFWWVRQNLRCIKFRTVSRLLIFLIETCLKCHVVKHL